MLLHVMQMASRRDPRSGTDVRFCKLPLPSIPKRSQWDLDQGNTQGGPKEQRYSSGRSPSPGGRCELQRGPSVKRDDPCNIYT